MDPASGAAAANPVAIARELEALAQTGLTFAQDHFDRERYTRVRELAAALLARHSDLDPATILRWSAAEFGYATPKVDVRAFILDGDRVLLIRENADEGRWSLPGGWAEVNETPTASVVREVREECGYAVRVLRLLAVFDREQQGHPPPFPYHVYKLFFHCAITGGQPGPGHESSAVAFHPLDRLPELSASRVLPAQLERLHAAVRKGEPVLCD
ncbi:MAG: NUDIX hydrolase [Verrucomicrobiales bacterium]|nr:NUDIX hydrolase [Verrucomicrobiales bacterium]MCP5526759.1 NUDIX hydrolase [Verrucomicrobiales bacterium]